MMKRSLVRQGETSGVCFNDRITDKSTISGSNEFVKKNVENFASITNVNLEQDGMETKDSKTMNCNNQDDIYLFENVIQSFSTKCETRKEDLSDIEDNPTANPAVVNDDSGRKTINAKKPFDNTEEKLEIHHDHDKFERMALYMSPYLDQK